MTNRPRERRTATRESRVDSFSQGAIRAGYDPQRGLDFAALTPVGQDYYADRIGDGAGHDQALADAHYSYGVKR